MNPQEKAQDLIESFYNVEDTEWIVDNGCGITWNEAKQCALIAVNELIKSAPSNIEIERLEHIGYWVNVGEEIEKL
jgi:hypothetical protein